MDFHYVVLPIAATAAAANIPIDLHLASHSLANLHFNFDRKQLEVHGNRSLFLFMLEIIIFSLNNLGFYIDSLLGDLLSLVFNLINLRLSTVKMNLNSRGVNDRNNNIRPPPMDLGRWQLE